MPLILPNTIQNAIPADGDKLGQNFSTIEDYVNQDVITSDGSTAMFQPLLLPGAPTQQNQAATKGYVDSSVPLGSMYMFAGDVEPQFWMFCRGQAISRATYAALFAVIGTRFGTGDNSTTFNLPSMQGRSPIGYWPSGTWANQPVGTQIGNADATLPSHNHGGVNHLHTFSGTTGAMDRSPMHSHWMRGVGEQTNAGGFGEGNVADISSTGFAPAFNTSDAGVDHLHGFSGTTAGADRSLDTGYAGGSASNANLPPAVIFNFIMKVQ